MPEAVNKENTKEPKVFSNIRFLIVDDTPVNLEMLQYFIENIGGIVSKAGNGLSAIKMLEENSFDVIIMDIYMPEMNGLEATVEIRKNTKTANIPIIGLSANVLKQEKQACLAAGMNNFVSKPVDFKNLTHIVLECLNPNKTLIDIQEQKTVNTDYQKINQAKPIDIEAYIDRMGGNREIAESIIKGFINHIIEQLVNIERAIRIGDIETVHREAHSIKGGASNVFANHLMEVAKELEIDAKSGNLQSAELQLDNIKKEYERIYEYVGNYINLS